MRQLHIDPIMIQDMLYDLATVQADRLAFDLCEKRVLTIDLVTDLNNVAEIKEILDRVDQEGYFLEKVA